MIVCSGCMGPLAGLCYRPYGTTAVYCGTCRSLDGRDFEWVIMEEEDEDLEDEDLEDEDLEDEDLEDDNRPAVDPNQMTLWGEMDVAKSPTPGQCDRIKIASGELRPQSFVVVGKIDYVAVWGHEGDTEERPCASFEEAADICAAAHRIGATVAYVDERPIASIDEDESQ